MSYIIEGLYVGGLPEASDTQNLINKGITHILTIDSRPLISSLTDGFSYKCVHALDMENTDMLAHFTECIMFITEGRASGGILVHCYAGQSRSVTVVLAYVMQHLSLNLDDALSLVKRQRPQIRPNPGFKEQLELFELMDNQVDPSNSHYKLYKLRNIANKMHRSPVSVDLLQGVYSDDPCLRSEPGTVLYKCRKCRRPLFRQSCILPHQTGVGDAAFDWRGKMANGNPEAESNECSSSFFIEPVQWMSEDIINIEGKLLCPKCQAKLGSFNWIGERCPCGTWVIPAFHIQTSKVDKVPPRLPHLNNHSSPAKTLTVAGLSLEDKKQGNAVVAHSNQIAAGLSLVHSPDGLANKQS